MAAIDVPFGWPDAFVSTLQRHQDRVLADVPSPGSAEAQKWRVNTLALRATDQYVKDRYHQRPIAVGFEKLGATAAAWSLIEAELRKGGAARAGVTLDDGRRIVETYPSAQMRAWRKAGVLPDGKGIKRTWERIEELAARFGVDLGHRAHELGDNEHLRDAFVCALTAGLLATTGECHPMTHNVDSEQSRREGVIWLHDPSVVARPKS